MAAKEKALTTYIPECDRWIKRFEDQLAIWWTPYNEKIYKAARSLPGASWEYNKQEMVVSAEFYKEIQAFAEKWEFRFTKKAEEIIEKYKEQEAGYETVSVPVTK